MISPGPPLPFPDNTLDICSQIPQDLHEFLSVLTLNGI
jgi:hypothetical protein